MCGCSPVCKSFFDTSRAAGSFAHVSGLSMRRILVAGRYGALRSGSGTPPRTQAGPVLENGSPEADHAIGCSMSGPELPAIRLGRGRPRRIPFQVASSSVDDRIPPAFLLLATTAHVMRAILLAMAIAAFFRGILSSRRASRPFGSIPSLVAADTRPWPR